LKRDAQTLVGIALLVFGMHFVASWWLIAPAFPTASAFARVFDVVAVVGVGGIWMSAFLGTLEEPTEVSTAPLATGEAPGR
jgi:hypothetical protein